MAKPIYLFLDFDGVLHRNNHKAFECVQLFANTIQNYNVNIVFSTSWREYSTLEKLKAYLPLSIQDKCIGLTPVIKEKIKHIRFAEINQYISVNNIVENWIALDDMRMLFPLDCPQLFLINGSEGFTEKNVQQLKETIVKLSQL